MYTIGEFSKINRITPKTLRYYEQIGLLKPARIDAVTGYRYYSTEQLPMIRKILRLKDLGLSLDEVREFITRPEQATLLLKAQQQRQRRVIEQAESRLARLEEYLITSEGVPEAMGSSVSIKRLPEVTVASMRTVVPGYESYFDIVPKMGEYMGSVGAICSEPAYCFTIYHDGEYREHDIDVEICEAVIEPCRESEQVKFKTVKEVTQAACLMHTGPYATLRESYNRLFSWIGENGFRVTDSPRESYIHGIWDREDPQQWLTELQIPVTKCST